MIAKPTGSGGPDQAPLGAVTGNSAVALDLPEGLFRALAEATGDVFYVLRTEPDLAFEFMSDSITALAGYTAVEFYADPGLLQRIIDVRDLPAMASDLAAPVGTDIGMDLRWVHRDGHTVWMNHRNRKRARKEGTVVIEGSGRDITALREAQERLAASEQEFRMLAENVTDVILRIGLDRRMEYASPSVSRIFGWDPAEIVGVPARTSSTRMTFMSWQRLKKTRWPVGRSGSADESDARTGRTGGWRPSGGVSKPPMAPLGMSSRWRATSRTRSVPSRHSRPARSVSGWPWPRRRMV